MIKDHRLIVALDHASYRKAARLVKSLSRYVKVFKVGSTLFTTSGPKIIKYIHKRGCKVFLDLKFNDIPNTVSNAAVQATRLGVYMLNVHALSGKEAMRKTAEDVKREAEKMDIFKPILVAVTVLTSLQEDDLLSLGVNTNLEELVMKLANATKESGFDGVVASPKEVRIIKERLGENFVVVTPGIRPKWASQVKDQKRVTTPRAALENGSDFIVVGRPITEARKPVIAVKKILQEIQ